tara:strand:+ start:4618 stop:5967 length:1350 start_codon:yes stop_codon:yes gene_type:complete
MEWHNPTFVCRQSAPTDYTDPAKVQKAVNDALATLKLPDDYVRPGDRVVLKPNWVKEHDERYPGPDQWQHVVTHPAVIEAVIRWAAERLNGKGSIIICDAPQTDSSFAKIREYCRIDEMIDCCRADFSGIEVNLLDLRPEEWLAVDGVTVSKTKLPGDPLGSTRVALNEASEFVGYDGLGKLYGASYDMAETNRMHEGTRHEYLLCRTPMGADVLINIPKLKTHKKVGLTCALKNLVGINANKNWLPHHTEGTPEVGGDQFPKATTKAKLEHSWMGRAKRILKNRPLLSRIFVPIKKLARFYFGDTQAVVRSGNWHGNDTCWRMVLDLNKCLFHFDGEGNRREKPLRYLAVVDGIIGGEGNGPMAPDAKPAGVIITGTHPAAVDHVAADTMGFEPMNLRLIRNSFEVDELNFTNFSATDIEISECKDSAVSAGIVFRPHFGWVGAIERG